MHVKQKTRSSATMNGNCKDIHVHASEVSLEKIAISISTSVQAIHVKMELLVKILVVIDLSAFARWHLQEQTVKFSGIFAILHLAKTKPVVSQIKMNQI